MRRAGLRARIWFAEHVEVRAKLSAIAGAMAVENTVGTDHSDYIARMHERLDEIEACITAWRREAAALED